MADFNLQQPINVKSAVDILIDRLTQAIIDDEYRAGDRIPTETELAELYGVSRNTVREALKTLTAYGVLETKRPTGTYVCSSFQTKALSPLLYGMIFQKQESYQNLIGLRKAIELGVYTELGERALSQETLDLIEKKHNAMIRQCVAESPDAERVLETDIDFHDTLAKLTDNDMLVSVNDMINRLTYVSRLKTIKHVLQERNAAYLIESHASIIEAIRSGEITKIYQALRQSYVVWKKVNES